MKSQGWSLFECLLVMALIAILSYVALPHFYSMFEQLKARLFIQQLVRTLNLVRITAMNEDEEASFCLTKDQFHCVSGPAIAYQVFTYEKGKPRVFLLETVDLPIELIWQGFSKGDKTTFTRQGECIQNGRLIVRSTQADFHFSKVIVISLTGRIRIE